MKKDKVNTPFRYQNDVSIGIINSTCRGVSSSKMWDFVTSGEVADNELFLVQMLYELEYLTSDQIVRCHMNDCMPIEYKRFSSGRKNPYRRIIAHLEALGIICTYGLFMGEQQVGVRIYALSEGASFWMDKQKNNRTPLFYHNSQQNTELKAEINPKFSKTEEILSILSRNNYHIKAVNSSGELLKTYTMRQMMMGVYEIAYYQTFSGWNIFMLSIRNAPNSALQAREALMRLINHIRMNGRERYSCIIINAETLEHAKGLSIELKECSCNCKSPIFYSTDIFTKEEENVFEHLIHFTKGGTTREYEIISIKIA